MEDLPESVMFDILSRLPVKTIIHCKCICKKWRNIVSDTHFVNDSPEKICAFDFDDETFKLFPSPLIEVIEDSYNHFQSLGVLKGCLCLADTFDPQFTIWVMKEYGIKKSWHKEVGLKDGTILMVFRDVELLAYCPTRKTVEDTQIFDRYLTAMSYRPSFLKLQNFELERVHVF
ncbi:F-box associated domain, type 1 [Artemisia annua]|uniref:F-box associated domain, type 1 n=1 Tax=Artemisia annua TaxID=35608 RepID=A0A2U1PYC3_ARTAN|nr:F-box associated domain, type 1 [Artemisia annua]